MRSYIADLPQILAKNTTSVTVAGWVNSRRDHGGLIFIDLRDASGIVQLVFQPEDLKLFAQADELRPEWVVEVSGQLKNRPAESENPKLITGQLELVAVSLRLLNKAQTLPITIHDSDAEVSEDKRLRYRYLDLRRTKMQKNLRLRANFYKFIRKFMEEKDFVEVPTPILANSSPEGARDFLIPSRIYPGKFYALPQAPQQFKQLLMVGGLPRYYQIATVFRDEDPRSDRLYGDFYQLDIEMAFVEDGAIIRQMFTPLIESLIKDFAKLKLYKDRFFEMTYQQAMDEYGTDKPDLRYDLKLTDLETVFKDTEVEILKNIIDQGGFIKGLVAPAILSRKQIDQLTDLVKERGAAGLAYLSYQNQSWQGPLLKFLPSEKLEQLAEIFNIKDGQTIFFIAHLQKKIVNTTLGQLRVALAEILNLANSALVAAVWIIDFPFYEENEQTKELAFAHNPFSKPRGDLTQADKLQIKADQYDLVLNGYECCSGAVRNHSPELLTQAFANLNYDLREIEAQFGALINAFKYGAPPHAGCAFGLDRILMVLAQETNIRELVAFPKNGSGVDVMTNTPAEIDSQQRKELGL